MICYFGNVPTDVSTHVLCWHILLGAGYLHISVWWYGSYRYWDLGPFCFPCRCGDGVAVLCGDSQPFVWFLVLGHGLACLISCGHKYKYFFFATSKIKINFVVAS